MRFSGALIFIFLLVSCGGTQNHGGGGTAPTGNQTAADDGSIPSFAEVYRGVIKDRCATCHGVAHGNSHGINLETYDNVVDHAERALTTVESRVPVPMPPVRAKQLSREEKALLIKWLKAGTPLEGKPAPAKPSVPPVTPPATSGPPPLNPPSTPPAPPKSDAPNGGPTHAPSYLEVANAVIKTKCAGCHSAPKNKGDVNLETYENVFKERALILSQIADGFMPPGKAPQLTPSESALLTLWLKAGAPR